MSDGLHPTAYLAITVAVLFGLALFFPTNGLTGLVIQEPSCGSLGCSELCSVDAPACSGDGMTCCATSWGTGVCDYSQNCATIQSYSDRMSLTQYQDTVREQPAPVGDDWARFLIPLIIIGGLAMWVVLSTRNKKGPLR